MKKIHEIRNIKLDDLVIGKGQTRVSDVGKDIDDLAESIKKQGLLQPIMVCPSEKDGKYEILLGQRRFLAYQMLDEKEILAAVLKEKVDPIQAKIISITENMVRRNPSKKDMIDVCTDLFKKYGTMKAVAEETGLPYNHVREYVKYDRLQPELKGLVDTGLNMKTALRAQDAASVTGEYDKEAAVKLAKEMSSMDATQQTNIVNTMETDPSASVDEVIEHAKSGAQITRLNITLGAEQNQSLKTYAKTEGTSSEDAATSLITEGLSSKGYLEE